MYGLAAQLVDLGYISIHTYHIMSYLTVPSGQTLPDTPSLVRKSIPGFIPKMFKSKPVLRSKCRKLHPCLTKMSKPIPNFRSK